MSIKITSFGPILFVFVRGICLYTPIKDILTLDKDWLKTEIP